MRAVRAGLDDPGGGREERGRGGGRARLVDRRAGAGRWGRVAGLVLKRSREGVDEGWGDIEAERVEFRSTKLDKWGSGALDVASYVYVSNALYMIYLSCEY